MDVLTAYDKNKDNIYLGYPFIFTIKCKTLNKESYNMKESNKIN